MSPFQETFKKWFHVDNKRELTTEHTTQHNTHTEKMSKEYLLVHVPSYRSCVKSKYMYIYCYLLSSSVRQSSIGQIEFWLPYFPLRETLNRYGVQGWRPVMVKTISDLDELKVIGRIPGMEVMVNLWETLFMLSTCSNRCHQGRKWERYTERKRREWGSVSV